MLKGPFSVVFPFKIFTSFVACSLNMGKKSLRIWKWKVGVRSFLFRNHRFPVRKIENQLKTWAKSLKKYAGIKFSYAIPNLITKQGVHFRWYFPSPAHILRLENFCITCGYSRSYWIQRMQNFFRTSRKIFFKPKGHVGNVLLCKERHSKIHECVWTRDQCAGDGKYHRKWIPRRVIRYEMAAKFYPAVSL